MRTPRISILSLALACFACNGKSSDGGTPPPSIETPTPPPAQTPAAVSRVDVEPPGANCAAGGQAVRVGLDLNGNGALDDDEVTAPVRYLCAEPASTVLVTTRAEPAGEHCQRGGTAVLSGLDRDGDDTLADAEVDQTTYVCAEALPPVLVKTIALAAGETCPASGTRVESGADLNRNDVLDPSEVTQSQVVCGPRVLVKRDEVPNADGCPYTATRVRSGADADGDGVLSDAEVAGDVYVCRTDIYGYTVRTQEDLDRLVDVSVIRGNLIIESPTLTTVDIFGVVVTGSIIIRDCPMLTGASIWPSLLGRDIEVSQTPMLGSLSVIINPDGYTTRLALPLPGSLTITDAPKLEYVDLERVPSIGGSLTLRRAGMEYVFAADDRHQHGLATIGGDLTIAECDRLRELDSMLTHVGGSLVIRDNAAPFYSGSLDLHLTSLGDRSGGGLFVANNAALTSVYLGDLVSVTGDVYVAANPQLALFQHPELATVTGHYVLSDNDTLPALGGFPPGAPELTIGGTLRVERNAALTEMPGFMNLVRAESVEVRDNPSLRWPNLTALGSASAILFERNGALELLGPSGLTRPGTDSLVKLRYSDALILRDNASLARLQLPMALRIDQLVVRGSPRLPTCQVQSLVAQVHPVSTDVGGTDDTATCP